MKAMNSPPSYFIVLSICLSIHARVSGEVVRPPAYTITDLGALEVVGLEAKYAKDVKASVGHAVSQQGEVVGEAFIPGGGGFGFRYKDGILSSLGKVSDLPLTTIQARGVDSRGRIVGYYANSTIFSAFLWENGVFQDLGDRRTDGKRGYAIAYAINSSGRIVGEGSGSFGSQRHALLWENGKATDIGTLASDADVASGAWGVNGRGEVVGYSGAMHEGAHCVRGFLWRQGSAMTALPTLGGRDSRANAINDATKIVGWSTLAKREVANAGEVGLGVLGPQRPTRMPVRQGEAPKRHAFLFENGSMRDLGTLGGADSEAAAINNAGLIVGWSQEETGKLPPKMVEGERAFLFAGGRMMDLNQLIPCNSGWILTQAHGINDKGQIVGEGLVQGRPAAFLLNPQ